MISDADVSFVGVTVRPSARQLFGPEGTPRAIVIGAGFGGIAAGVKMRQRGIDTFTIYESSLGVGGTWWDNTYPGAEVDVASHVYSYSFHHHDWTRTHARQAELQQYLEEVVDRFGLRPHLRLGVGVRGATWDDERHVWNVQLADGRTDEAHVVISAVGFLNVPRHPDWPGLDLFQGPRFHTSRWEHEHDLTDKTVAVVGVGSTATQVVPAIQPIVKQLYVFQREPSWVTPKGDRDFTPEERRSFRSTWRRKKERWRLKYLLEKNSWGGAIYRPDAELNQKREQACREYIQREFADRPDLVEALTPSYPFAGKRPVITSAFYPALKHDNVELVPRAVASVTRTGVVDVDGVERAVDVLVTATGFQPADYLARLDVVGREGRSLKEAWHGEPQAFLGITVPGFPNFFILYGPGTNGGEIVTMLESQSEYAVRAMKRMQRERVTAIEVRRSADARWDRWLQSKVAGTSWVVSNNYFKAPTGKVITQWPYGATFYRVLTKVMGRLSETTRTRRVT
jgi:cation diffusion facilitator CzcD-associated flavoprotein CzcO